MAALPSLSNTALRVLEILVDRRNIVRGGDLMRFAQIASLNEFSLAINELRRNRLIEIGGDTSDDGLPYATFGILPSSKEYLSFVLDQRRPA